jgi:hypothetical protein
MRLTLSGRRQELFGAIAAAIAMLSPAAAGHLPVATPIVWTRSQINVPPAIQASLPERGLELVSVVTADIDADGDLDVVASDSKLDLFVWLNDGQGHLSRRAFQRSTTWQPEPGDPAVHDRASVPNVSLQNEPPSVGLDTRLASGVRDPATSAPRGITQVIAAASISTRIPRAPPTALRS